MAATATHHDDHHHAPALPDATVDVRPVRLLSLGALAVGAAAYLIGGFVGLGQDGEHGVRDFFLAYLCGFVFWCSLPFGSLLLSMIGYLAQASWGIIFRRIFQASLRTLPLLLLLGLPVVAAQYVLNGDQSPFWWGGSEWKQEGVTDAHKKHWVDHAADEQVAETKAALVAKGKSAAEADTEAAGKRTEFATDAEHEFDEAVKKYETQGHNTKTARLAAYTHTPPEAAEESLHKIKDWLSPGKFAIRYLIYFVILGGFAFFLHRRARRTEEVEDTARGKHLLQVISGPGIPICVLTLTLFVTDWVMSVEPTWASSMFPVVFGFNMFLTTIAFSTLVFYSLTKVPGDPTAARPGRPDLTAVIKDKFRIDIGSLTLGFCMVWAYASFCQFMLIWAGNLPEEIPYYLKRGAGNEDSFAHGLTGSASGWIYLTYILMAFHWLLPFIALLFREVKTSPRGMKAMACLLLTVCACDVCWWILPSVPHPNTWLHLPMAFGAILMVGGIWGVVFAWQLGKRPILGKDSDVKFLAEWGHH